jgi:predicted nucleotide-binding protein
MGVALTWGNRVIPIREEAAPDLPSDISGRTWIKYRNSMDSVLDDQFDRKLSELVKRAIRKKNGP